MVSSRSMEVRLRPIVVSLRPGVVSAGPRIVRRPGSADARGLCLLV